MKHISGAKLKALSSMRFVNADEAVSIVARLLGGKPCTDHVRFPRSRVTIETACKSNCLRVCSITITDFSKHSESHYHHARSRTITIPEGGSACC